MIHITNSVLIFSLGVGLAAIAVSAQIYRRYRLGYLRAHLAIVISFNLMLFLNIIALYIFNLPPGTAPDSVQTVTGIGLQFLVPLLQLFAAYFFLQIIWGMLGKPVAARIRNIAWMVIIGYAAAQAIAIAARGAFTGIRLPQIIGRLAWFSTLVFIYTILLSTMREIGAVGDRKKKNALRAYWLLLLGLITVVIVLILLNSFGILTIMRYNLFTGFLIVAMNAVPILYLGWFAEKFHERPAIDWRADSDATLLFGRYDISPREQEIVMLICSGKTNKQIAGELFISLQTVKDHAYRIFRKTGVKNRVQLANLFLNASGAPREDSSRRDDPR
jgi:DNA-binding CsgD family transcriptional regulator